MNILHSLNICNLIDAVQRVHAARPVNTNSLAFLVTGICDLHCHLVLYFSLIESLLTALCNWSFDVTVLLLFMILNSHQMSPNFLVCILLMMKLVH